MYDTESWVDRRRFAEALCSFIDTHYGDREGPYEIAVDREMDLHVPGPYERNNENLFIIETIPDDSIDACQAVADKWFDIR